MASQFDSPHKQSAIAFWKSYFAKFRRRVSDQEVSETGPAPLSATPDAGGSTLPFPDRRRKHHERHSLLR
jgi:hypothetical protein